MSSDWNDSVLSDVIDFNPKEELKKGKTAKKIAMEELHPFDKKVNGFTLAEYSGGAKFRNGDTLLARITPCLENGKTAYVDILEKDEIAFGSTEFIVMRAKTGITDEAFIYYLATSPAFRAVAIQSMTGTSGRQRVQNNLLENAVFRIPTLPEQRAIAATLSALDDKIELNNRINKTLEEMAQALFKQWFVDFEFPDENGQPYKSSGGEMEESELGPIPKGWKVSGLGEIIETVNGFSYKGSDIKESVNAMMTIKNFNRNGGFNAVGFKEIEISERVKDKHHVDLFDVVVACTDITQKADIIGNPVLVLTKGKYRKIVISMDLVKVIVKHPFISSCLIYMFLKDIRFKQQALGYTSGTTVLHLNKMVFSDYPVIIPEDEKLLEKMSFIIEPIFHLIGMTIDNSQNLTSLRDTLLPKLMSGEIRVPIEEVATDV